MNQESHFNFKQAGFFTLAFTDFLLPTLTHVFTGKEKSMPKQSGRDRLGWHSGWGTPGIKFLIESPAVPIGGTSW